MDKKTDKYRFLKSNYLTFIKKIFIKKFIYSEKIFSIRNDPRDALLARALKAKTIVSSSINGGKGFIDTDLKLREDINRYQWNEVLFERLSIEKRYKKNTSDKLFGNYLLVHTGSTEIFKKLPFRYLLEIISSLYKLNEIKIICNSDEINIFRTKFKKITCFNEDDLSFENFTELIKNCGALLCNDSGPMHLLIILARKHM